MGRLNKKTYAKNLTNDGINAAIGHLEEALALLAYPCSEAGAAREAAGSIAKENPCSTAAQLAFAKADAAHARILNMKVAIAEALRNAKG